MNASPSSLHALSSEIAALVARAERSVVGVQAEGRRASGYFWRPDVVVTASDALEAGKGETVKLHLADGELADARVLGHDPTTDVALIKPERAVEALSSTSQGAPRLGTSVLALGRSAYGATCATGCLSLVGPAWQSMRGGEIASRLWLDVRLPAHAEGGPVLDPSGALLGMAVFGPRRRTLVIPAETIERVGAEILLHGHVRQGYLGVSVQAVRASGSQDRSGLMVVSLDEKGPAHAAGILQGDILVQMDGRPLESPRALATLLPGSLIGSSVRVDLLRTGQGKSLEIIIGERPRA